MPQVELSRTVNATATIIRLFGEIDLINIAATAVALDEAATSPPPPRLVVLDLTGLQFISIGGVRMVHVFADSCANRGAEVRLVANPDSIVSRFIGYDLLEPRLSIFASIEATLRAD